MTGDFPLRSLASVARVRSGCAFKSTDMGSAGVPIIKIKNITPPTVDVVDCERVPLSVIESIAGAERYELSNGDILIAMTGATVGKVGRFPLTDERYYLNQRVGKVYLTNPDEADYRFLYYVLSQDTYVRQIFAAADGSAQANVSGTQIESFQISIPPLSEQRAIAHILGTLDDKIELNRRMNETLEAMARAIFKSWFVDFDPVRAKAEGRKTGLPKPIAALFPDSFEDSEWGRIPRGWCAATWGDQVSLEYGKSLRGYEGSNGPYPVYGTNGRIGSHSEPLCPHPGIVIGRKGAYRGIHFSPQPFFVIDTAFFVKPLCEVDLRWAYYEMLRIDINGMDSGSAIPSTSRDSFHGLSVVVPPHRLQRQFALILTPAWERQQANQRETTTLAALRDTLLPKLLSGEIRVADAEKIVEGVA